MGWNLAEAAQQRNYPPQGPSRGSTQLWCMTSDWHYVSGRPLDDDISYMNMALRMGRDKTPGWQRNGQVDQETATIQKLSDHFQRLKTT